MAKKSADMNAMLEAMNPQQIRASQTLSDKVRGGMSALLERRKAALSLISLRYAIAIGSTPPTVP